MFALSNAVAALAFIISAAVVVVVIVLVGRPLHAKVGNIEFQVGGVAIQVADIDRAVNGKPAGEPTLSGEVGAIHSELRDLTTIVQRDRHAMNNALAIVIANVDDNVRLALAETQVSPMVDLKRVLGHDPRLRPE